MSPYTPNDPPDDLDAMIAEWSRRSPAFQHLLDADVAHGELMSALRDLRLALGLSQTQVAAAMGTSQSAVARLEMAETDPRLSTVARYALAVGHRLEYALVPITEADAPARPRRSA